jgi:aryl-alcohol dehydrogenase-like predicted oxidoreductase
MADEPGYDVYEYSRRGKLEDLRETLRNGTRPDQYMAYDGSTALVMAARSGQDHIVKELLGADANVNICTDDGSTMVHHAVAGKSVPALKAVMAAGLDVNACNEDNISPLMLAAHYGPKGVVEALLTAGADIHLSAQGWGSALDSAQDDDVAKLLESHGAKRALSGNETFQDQPMASASERYGYGCLEHGMKEDAVPQAPVASAVTVGITRKGKLGVGDTVKLRQPKAGLLQDGQTGEIVADDGSDYLPLKVRVGDGHDYYNVEDLEGCGPVVELPPDSDRATAEGTLRRVSGNKQQASLGTTGLTVSPVGFGCHRLCDLEAHKTALSLALQMGCNLVDLAPNYSDGEAETVAGIQIEELITTGKLRRDEVVVLTKVGNVLGQQLQHIEGVPNMSKINDNLYHCISPKWIDGEITRSLQRLRLKCVDCVLLHAPEYELKSGVDENEIYARLKAAFTHLEAEVARGRIAMYGISGAFYPLRPTDPEHLDLERVMKQLPEGHHFRVLQFPLNFAECEILSVANILRKPDGSAIDRDRALSAPTLFETARAHGLATLTNRPLDGIYKESHGVLRFSSLDCDVRSFSELQLDNCDVLEEKLTMGCNLDQPPYNAGEGASGQLAEKTVKVLSSLEEVDCVLLGMRQPEYVVQTAKLALFTPSIPSELARKAVKTINNTVTMWYATAIHEADHGTAKDWRLPVQASQL